MNSEALFLKAAVLLQSAGEALQHGREMLEKELEAARKYIAQLEEERDNGKVGTVSSGTDSEASSGEGKA
jgi:hypothetical protein